MSERLAVREKPMEGISVIMPAYNEAGVIYQAACESARAMEDSGRPYEIIVVDDGSTDDTTDEVRRAGAEYSSITAITLPENRGKGNALKRGFQVASMELACFLDADLDLHPSLIGDLLSEMERTNADIVIGSKRHPESRLEYPRIRRVYSTIYYYLILLLFRLPLKDTQTGIKLFRREVLARVLPRIVSKEFVLDLELLVVANRLNYRIAEAPIQLDFNRAFGRIAWRDVQGIIRDTMAIFYRTYVLGYYDTPIKPMVAGEPRMSIVIPSVGLDDMAEECVRKCNQLNYFNYDIRFIPDSPVDLDLRQPGSKVIPSGPVGPAIKRNIGVENSDAEIIAFVDADAFPDYSWLKSAVPYFEDDTVAAVCGPAVTPARDSKRQQASGLIYSATLVSGTTTFRYTYRAYREVDDYPTCNLLVRRSDFDQVGGFHSEFWPGEDTVLCHKLTQDLGKRIVYVPTVAVSHHRRPVYRAHLRQVYSYARHRGFFARKFPETSLRLQYFVPSVFVLFLLAGTLASFFNPIVMQAFLSVLGLYLILVLASSIKSPDILVDLLVFLGIIATHITYGVGFILGLLARKMKEQ